MSLPSNRAVIEWHADFVCEQLHVRGAAARQRAEHILGGGGMLEQSAALYGFVTRELRAIARLYPRAQLPHPLRVRHPCDGFLFGPCRQHPLSYEEEPAPRLLHRSPAAPCGQGEAASPSSLLHRAQDGGYETQKTRAFQNLRE